MTLIFLDWGICPGQSARFFLAPQIAYMDSLIATSHFRFNAARHRTATSRHQPKGKSHELLRRAFLDGNVVPVPRSHRRYS